MLILPQEYSFLKINMFFIKKEKKITKPLSDSDSRVPSWFPLDREQHQPVSSNTEDLKSTNPKSH
jgi:hypothetical protein